MTGAEFGFIAQFLKERSGLIITQDKMYLLETRLAAILRDNNLDSLAALVDVLRQPGAASVKDQVVDAMTTNETSFFRDNNPFDALRKSVIPGLIERRAASRSLRIWSAACSTGQEPYSLAMMLKDSFPILGGWKVEIVATDLSPSVLERAREGLLFRDHGVEDLFARVRESELHDLAADLVDDFGVACLGDDAVGLPAREVDPQTAVLREVDLRA